MRLHRLHLENFRQFRSGSISFAQNGDFNATVIHGQNGSGKTTLKNAMTWVLYEELDSSFSHDRLASQGAMAEIEPGDSVRVSVTLEFEHEETEYELIRWGEYQRQAADDFAGELVDDGLSLTYHSPNGSRGTRNNPRDWIEQILPKRLSGLFFFDGEYINKLSETRSQTEIRQAIRNIMGLTIIERSITHLEAVEERFEEELQAAADNELKTLINERGELKDRKQDHEQALSSAEESRETLKAEISETKRKLERIDDSAELEQKRVSLENDLEEVEDRIDEINDEIENTISTKGHLPFAMPAVEETAKELDKLRDEGSIPSEVSNQFIEQLLDDGKCICGRPLEDGTDAYQEVQSYKSDAVTEGFDQAAIQIISHLSRLNSEREEYFETVSNLLNERSQLRDEQQELAERISEISGQLEEIDTVDPETGETPSELEQARDKKADQLEQVKEDIIRHEVKIEEIDGELTEVNKEIDKARQDAQEAKLARKRMRAAESVRKQLETSFEDLQSRVRNWSNQLVEKTFDEIATKEYKAEITEKFELRIKDQIEDKYLEVEKSRGERQIASLTFIGSLVQIARERYESSGDPEYFSGGIYPILMDSPFGALDDDHRRQVSRVIPQMAEQVIVLVTDSQWRGPVANEMSEIAGKQYWLNYDAGEGEGSYPHTIIEEETKPQEDY